MNREGMMMSLPVSLSLLMLVLMRGCCCCCRSLQPQLPAQQPCLPGRSRRRPVTARGLSSLTSAGCQCPMFVETTSSAPC
jgi:hypothetical protein